jgi:vacuolar-type H+-ATPase subunit H
METFNLSGNNFYEMEQDKILNEVGRRVDSLNDLNSKLFSKETEFEKLQEQIRRRKDELLSKRKEIEEDINKMENNIKESYNDFLSSAKNTINKDSEKILGDSSESDILISINLLRELLEGKAYDVNCREKEIQERQRRIDETLSKLEIKDLEKYNQMYDASVYDTETQNNITKSKEDFNKIQSINFDDYYQEIQISIRKLGKNNFSNNSKITPSVNQIKEQKISSSPQFSKKLNENLIIVKDSNIIDNLKLMELHDQEMLMRGDDLLNNNKIDFESEKPKEPLTKNKIIKKEDKYNLPKQVKNINEKQQIDKQPVQSQVKAKPRSSSQTIQLTEPSERKSTISSSNHRVSITNSKPKKEILINSKPQTHRKTLSSQIHSNSASRNVLTNGSNVNIPISSGRTSIEKLSTTKKMYNNNYDILNKSNKSVSKEPAEKKSKLKEDLSALSSLKMISGKLNMTNLKNPKTSLTNTTNSPNISHNFNNSNFSNFSNISQIINTYGNLNPKDNTKKHNVSVNANNSHITNTEENFLYTQTNGSNLTNTFKSKFFMDNSNKEANTTSKQNKVFFKSKIFN